MDGLEQNLPNNLNEYLRIKQKKKSNKKMSWSSVLTSALKCFYISTNKTKFYHFHTDRSK